MKEDETIDRPPAAGAKSTGSQTARPTRSLPRRLALARAALAWELFWPAFWPVLGLCGLFLALALFDVLPLLPGWLHAGTLAVFGAAVLAAFWRLLRSLRWPPPRAARRRLERDSGLPHRPLEALDDRLIAGRSDRGTSALWEAHRQRLLAQAAKLRVKPPSAGLARVDPVALRIAIGLLLILAGAVSGRDWPAHLEAALTPRLAAAGSPPTRLDVWINPPTYTSLPPLFLDAGRPGTEPIRVPVGSAVLAQVQGRGGTPQLHLGSAVTDFSQITTDVYKVSGRLDETERLAIMQDGAVLVEWPLDMLPDTPPAIEFLGPPGRTERSTLRIDYRAKDDYGLNGITATIRRIDAPQATPLRIELPLPGHGLRDTESTSYHDLTPHPWAGLAVEMQLEARDALDQVGSSEVVRSVLPERIFNHPVARALVELRKQLTLDPDNRFPVAQALGELNNRPEHFFHDVVVALALRSAEKRLHYDRSPGAVGQVQWLMWDTALRIEEGELATAERELRELQEELMRALAEGAPDEEIERLISELREALDRFLAALAEQMSEQLAEGMEPQPLPPDAQIVESDQLREMLDRARELARSGARDAARELLAQLRDMLENLRANPLARGLGEEGQNAWKMMRDMESLMRRQQELLDRSFERSQQGRQPGEGPPQDLDPGRMQSGEPSDNRRDAQNQDAVRRSLGVMMRQLGEALGDIPRPLGRAEQAMRDARDALAREAPGEAIDPQSRALDQLQQGLQAMADRFMERLGQGRPQRGSGQVGMDPGGRDPLGRRMGEGGMEALEGVEIPDQMELRRARRILDELRRRRGERSRPPLELDYIDRLLQQF